MIRNRQLYEDKMSKHHAKLNELSKCQPSGFSCSLRDLCSVTSSGDSPTNASANDHHCPVTTGDNVFFNTEMSMYDASPTALYIYEQEKNDMQCLQPTVIPNTSLFLSSPTSLDMSLPELRQNEVTDCLWSSGSTKAPGSWSLDDADFVNEDLLNMSEMHDLGQINIDEVFQRDQDPTLAELNCNSLSAILSPDSSQDVWKEQYKDKKAKDEPWLQTDKPTCDAYVPNGYFPAANPVNPSTEIQTSIKREWYALNDPNEATRRQTWPSSVDKKWEELRQFVDRPLNSTSVLQRSVKTESQQTRATSTSTSTANCTVLKQFLARGTDDEVVNIWDTRAQETPIKRELSEPLCCHGDSDQHSNPGPSPDTTLSSAQPDQTIHATAATIKEELELDSDVESHDDWTSDGDSDSGGDHPTPGKRRRKEPRYFWQYNAQAKGPKGAKLYLPSHADDPHVLHVFEDPVFDPEQTSGSIRHSGKARRGDGNDIMPSPMKLYQIGDELKKLTGFIDRLTPAGDAPVNVKNRSKREKNKLASRACRLKKKAQHEANKIKLHGLEEEHCQLIQVLETIKSELRDHVGNIYHKCDGPVSEYLEKLIKTNLKSMIAGHTTEYVNSILEKIEAGEPNGGIKRKIH